MANKIPTTAQWSDLASKMNSKARITMTGTDPGEGGTLAENSLIGVYDQEKYIDTSDLADKAVTADKIDFTTMSTFEGYATNVIGKSDIGAGASVNGSLITFSNLDTSQKYVVDYFARFTVQRINDNGTTHWGVQYSTDGGSTWRQFTGGGGAATVREATAGVEASPATGAALLCFSGVSEIRLRVACTVANAVMRYDIGGVTAKLYKVPNSFTTNV